MQESYRSWLFINDKYIKKGDLLKDKVAIIKWNIKQEVK